MTDTPGEEQIAQGVAHFRALRENQRQIQNAIEELKKFNAT
jgi:hypothetical protein